MPALGQYLIVNPAVSVEQQPLDQNTLRSIFSLQLQHWPDGSKIHLFVQPLKSQAHQTFVKNRLGLFPYQLTRSWDRKIYAGRADPPTIVQSDQEMLEKVATVSGAIGYVSQQPQNEEIHVDFIR